MKLAYTLVLQIQVNILGWESQNQKHAYMSCTNLILTGPQGCQDSILGKTFLSWGGGEGGGLVGGGGAGAII